MIDGWLMLLRTVSETARLAARAHARLVEEAVRDLVDGRVDPVEDPVPVEGLEEGRVERVVRARDRGAEVAQAATSSSARVRCESAPPSLTSSSWMLAPCTLSRWPLSRITPPRAVSSLRTPKRSR